MSFLFKSSSKQKGGPTPNALPPAARDLRSSDGPPPGAQVPTLNGLGGMAKPGSPVPAGMGSVNASLNSIPDTDRSFAPAPQQQPQQQQQSQQQQQQPPPQSMRSTTPGGGAQIRAVPPEEKQVYLNDSTRPSGPPSPDQKALSLRSGMGGVDATRARPSTSQTRQGAGDPSPYPWSSRPLNFTVSHTNPFPRYGAAVNATASKDGSVYLMGGLINGSTVKGDLWMVETGSMTCFPVATTSEGPGPRVGHASLLVGNAFIVFGGDTKMDEGDQLDDTLYLLNTSTKQWSRALPVGPRPPGRYGQTLNILGSKIYIFGGQVEGYFFNDLWAFDLNALQQATNRWEMLIQNTIDGGPQPGQIPPARTNHTMVTWGDKLYLFGGTDGVHWFNDVWSYSPHTNSWTQLECIGYIPSPREGHAAALVGDVMYIFGGRTEEGNDLGDLAAFRISSRRWYTFQNMGSSPSPRSGHSMTTVGKQIVVLAGEPSSAPRDPVELAFAYFLDTGKIRYPPDSGAQAPTNERIQGLRRPSGEKPPPALIGAGRGQPPSRPGDRAGSGDARMAESRLPQVAQRSQQISTPNGPPPQAPPQQVRTMGMLQSRQPSRPDRALSPNADGERMGSLERAGMTSPPPPQSQIGRGTPTPQESSLPTSPSFAQNPTFFDAADGTDPAGPRVYRPETYQPSQDQSAEGLARSTSRGGASRSRGEVDRVETPRESTDAAPEHLPKVRELQRSEDPAEPTRPFPQDSGIGSSPALTQQYDELAKELEQSKQRNAWFASELALARKSGYQTRSSADSPVMDERGTDVFADDDKPLVEALLKMREELSRVQGAIDEQSRSAAERIAAMEKQRDAAINEAVYAKTRLAGQGGSVDGDGKRSPDADRSHDLSRRLAVSLAAQTELSGRLDGLTQEIESEKKARALAEDTADAAQRRVAELDTYRQQHGSELETTRAELHGAQREARDVSTSHAELKSQHDMLAVDKKEADGRLERALADAQNHATVLSTLREALAASTEKAQMLEQRLEEQRGQRDALEQSLQQLRVEHGERTRDLETMNRRLKDAEELSDRHAAEAKTHREAVLAGLGRVSSERDVKDGGVVDERVALLQQQVDASNVLVRQNQGAADAASEKLRRAEERIAGLEAFQEQASREGLSIRKQLQSAIKDNQGLSAAKAELEQKMQSQLLETNALAVQHASLKDVLGERGISASDVRKSRVLDSPSSLNRFSTHTPDLSRVRELEQQLDASLRSHDEMKAQFDDLSERDDKMRREYERKLTTLDNDHQAAVKYLRGTEKMLSKMKQELQRVKNENGELKRKAEKAAEEPGEWHADRERLQREVADGHAALHAAVAKLEARIAVLQSDLQSSRSAHDSTRGELADLHSSHADARADVEKLTHANASLDARARDAENKVQLLLDQVESSVDQYRRVSRLGGTSKGGPTLLNGSFHARSLSDETSSSALEGSAAAAGLHTHVRNLSADSDSVDADERAGADGSEAGPSSSSVASADARNSLALDSLASELDALRTHWETTNKNYRLSDKFDFERTPTSATPTTTTATTAATSAASAGAAGSTGGGAAGGGEFSSLASWRRGLDLSDDGEEEGAATASRPGTRDGEADGAARPREADEDTVRGNGSP